MNSNSGLASVVENEFNQDKKVLPFIHQQDQQIDENQDIIHTNPILDDNQKTKNENQSLDTHPVQQNIDKVNNKLLENEPKQLITDILADQTLEKENIKISDQEIKIKSQDMIEEKPLPDRTERSRINTSELNKFFTTEVAELEDFYKAYDNKTVSISLPLNVEKIKKQTTSQNRSITPERHEINQELPNNSIYLPVKDEYEDEQNVYSFKESNREAYRDKFVKESLAQKNQSSIYFESINQKKGHSPNILERLNLNSKKIEEKLKETENEGNQHSQNSIRINRKVQNTNEETNILKPPVKKFDEKPIVANQKTFEQLLEQELLKIGEPIDDLVNKSLNIDDQNEEQKDKKRKQTFLRKNEGKNIANLIVNVPKSEKERKTDLFEEKRIDQNHIREKQDVKNNSKHTISAKPKKRETVLAIENDSLVKPREIMSEINKLFDNFQTLIQNEFETSEEKQQTFPKTDQNTKIEDQIDNKHNSSEKLPVSVEIGCENIIIPFVESTFHEKKDILLNFAENKETLKIKFEELKKDVKLGLESKLIDLQTEIEKYRHEFILLQEKIASVNKKEHDFEHEKAIFEKFRDDEIKKIDELKEEELKKIKREKQIALRNLKSNDSKPSKREKDEFESFKQQTKIAEEEFLIKEKKFKMTIEKQRKKIEDLQEEINELKTQMDQKHNKNDSFSISNQTNFREPNLKNDTSKKETEKMFKNKSIEKKLPSDKKISEKALKSGILKRLFKRKSNFR